jgi:hypothetical protein
MNCGLKTNTELKTKPEKRKRLESASWRVGMVSEFLGETEEEAALIELKLDLARAVKAERIRHTHALPSL